MYYYSIFRNVFIIVISRGERIQWTGKLEYKFRKRDLQRLGTIDPLLLFIRAETVFGKLGAVQLPTAYCLDPAREIRARKISQDYIINNV